MSNDMVPNQPEPNSSMGTAPTDGGMIAAWQSGKGRIATSLDLEKPQGKADYLKALTAADRNAKHSVGQDLPVRDWFLHEIQLTNDETGELSPALRLVFILEDGTAISTTSEPLLNNWRHVLRMYGNGPWSPPLTMRLRAVKARVMGEYLQIASIVTENAPVQTGKKK